MKDTVFTVRDFLAGRIWHREHIPFAAEIIDEHIAAGQIKVISGVSKTTKFFQQRYYFCRRCENEEQSRFTTFHCAKCDGPCAYCRQCLKMGRVSVCTELITWTGEDLVFANEHQMAWQGNLTPLQKKASAELIESNRQKKSHLIYAVCGAGKTEILFEPIYELLKEGKRVCLAAPRVDVILELEPRLKAAFPKTPIDALYGGAKPSLEPAQLILATTHQLYRFQEAFDVVFVDEADAFPYTADETLKRAVKKAAKQDAPIHFVTATPSKQLIAQATQHAAISSIPRRFHGHPLPVPRYESLWNYKQKIEKGILPPKLVNWIRKRLEREQPFLIFFHHIELMEKALPIFQTVDERIQSVHAAHENRKAHVLALRNNKVPGLLTTTILERGITIPNVQVAVVGAEQQIFTKGALVQIGGRVGRAVTYPDGDFVLFHHGISNAMDDARQEILNLNKKGGKL
ncbi:DEAD/DEAH box helicase [Sporosarcina ureilytica]|uniref:DNA/RNA helicase n=1 Tax=Sporosarcina ureilytica TaxID=298596 RepID=A0A1D8JIH3_9BACL|nr:DEAD/DEAH box helicase family protein [Sporosarcina ureilytica]AOV08520.1 DNA/RNA helicase [Sporosarcina ureilytica]